jgi:hypothetical protein
MFLDPQAPDSLGQLLPPLTLAHDYEVTVRVSPGPGFSMKMGLRRGSAAACSCNKSSDPSREPSTTTISGLTFLVPT